MSQHEEKNFGGSGGGVARRRARTREAWARDVMFAAGEMVLMAARRAVVWVVERVMKCVCWDGGDGGVRRGRPGF